MKRIAKFEKVSYEQFKIDWKDTFDSAIHDIDDKEIKDIYYPIELPTRATSGSAGYDFHAPSSFVLEPGQTIKIPTGIRCYIEDGWVLQVYPRSGLGFKYRLQLDNTVGIIDSDYYNSDNEGHIMLKMTNIGDKWIRISKGEKIAQGIFYEYGVTVDDNVDATRNGGFGSTDKK